MFDPLAVQLLLVRQFETCDFWLSRRTNKPISDRSWRHRIRRHPIRRDAKFWTSSSVPQSEKLNVPWPPGRDRLVRFFIWMLLHFFSNWFKENWITFFEVGEFKRPLGGVDLKEFQLVIHRSIAHEKLYILAFGFVRIGAGVWPQIHENCGTERHLGVYFFKFTNRTPNSIDYHSKDFKYRIQRAIERYIIMLNSIKNDRVI